MNNRLSEEEKDEILARAKQNRISTVLAVSGLTPKLFCKVHSEYWGEKITQIEQISGEIYDGKELYELCAAMCQAACANAKGEQRED